MIPTDRLCQIVDVQNPQVAKLLAEIRSRDALIRRLGGTVDTLDLKSDASVRESSTLSGGTIIPFR